MSNKNKNVDVKKKTYTIDL